MADYYPLIAKAVSSFSSAQDRLRLYGHGRSTLMTELRALKLPLSAATIAKERLAAIRKVEGEQAGRAQESSKDVR